MKQYQHIDIERLKPAYENFFLKQEAGIYFLAVLNNTIDTKYKKAEDNPEISRDIVQSIKGIREILSHIDSVINKSKK